MNIKLPAISKIALYSSIGLFIISLTQPCYCTEAGCGEQFGGLMILITGSLAFFSFPAGITWLANVTLFIAWTARKSMRTALVASIISSVLSFSFLFFTEVMVNEAGGMSPVIRYQSGYWLWLASSLIMLASVITNYTQPKVTDDAPEAYKKPAADEMLLKCQWIYANGKMHGDVNCNRIEWLVTHYLIKTDTRDGGWTTIYKDPEDGRYWVRNFPHGEMHGGGPPQLYCIGDNSDYLYKGMTVNERLQVSGSISSFETAVKQNDVEAAIAILRRVELKDESIDAILRNEGLKH